MARFHSSLRAIEAFAALPVSDPFAEVVCIALLMPMLLAVAFWNGFPIIFYDTGAYLLEGLGHVFIAERAPVYSLFLAYGGARASLWLIAALQVACTSFAIVETARAVAPRLSLGACIAIGAGLVLLTGLAWSADEIEPDCFAPLAVLSLYLLAFHREGIGPWRRAALTVLAALSIGVHPSHVLLGGALVAVLGVYRAMCWLGQGRNWPRAHLLYPVAGAAMGVALIFASNFALTGALFFSRAGPAVLFARLLQDGIVMRLLDDTCPQAHYRLCAYKEVLPRTTDQWLWGPDSPFLRMGRFTGTSAESSRIIRESLKRYPVLQARAALSDTLAQLAEFRTGDQIEPQQWVLLKPFGQFIPAQVPSYLAARQQRNRIDFKTINDVHVPVGWLSLAGLAALLCVSWRRRERGKTVFLAFVVSALVANAAICGVVSNPHNRYQSRIIWLAPFALALIVVNRSLFVLRGWGESGT